MNDFLETRSISNRNSVVKSYRTIIRVEEILEQVEVGNTVLLRTVHYDLNKLRDLSIGDIVYCETEEYQKIKKIMEKFNVMPEEKAKKKMDAWHSQLDPIIPDSKKSNNAGETIARFFETISMWYTGLFSNKLYQSAFELSRMEEITIKPFELKVFATSYEAKADEATRTTYVDFLQQSEKFFGKDSNQIIEHFVLSERHPEANPLFLGLEDSVLVSPHFAEFFSYALHAILDRDILDKEVEKRSRLFESSIVKEEFEKQVFRYLPNQGIKNKMQIDGIAISNSKVYVIEAKGWKAKDLIQDSYTREILEDEIRNAIDGLDFTRNSGKTTKKVSLPEKVEWVKNQRKKLGISAQADIIGILVINREPVISEYKGCIVRYVDDFEFN
jgi:nuclease-like protein